MGVLRGGKEEAESGNLGEVGRLLGGAGSCPGCAPHPGGNQEAGWTPAKVSADILWDVEHSVLWTVAEIPETASRDHPEAKHRGRAGV